MNEVAIQIKNAVNINDVFSLVGLSPNRKGFIVCPFHNEKTASLKLFNGNSYYCFGCGRGGDVISFYQNFYNESFIEAAKHLNSDFNLNLFLDKKQKKTYYQKRKIQDLKINQLALKCKQAEIKRIENNREIWLNKFIKSDLIINSQKPKNVFDVLCSDFVEAIKNIEYYWYMFNSCEDELWRMNNE